MTRPTTITMMTEQELLFSTAFYYTRIAIHRWMDEWTYYIALYYISIAMVDGLLVLLGIYQR